jgi:hypothetical protein
LKSFYNTETGAVSVYLILIIVPVFMFQAILIDFARVKLAEKESESAIKAAVRSAMSAYDTELQAMGLYGLGVEAEEAESMFSDIFSRNLSGGIDSDFFRFIDTMPVEGEARLTPVYALANHTVFERQILEDMKFKAPIEFALEITDKFKTNGVASQLKQGSLFSKEAEKLEKLLDKREEALDEAWDHTQSLKNKINSLHTYYQARIQELSGMSAEIGIHTIEDLQASIREIELQVRAIEQSMNQLDGSLSALMQQAQVSEASIMSILQSKYAMQEQISELNERRNEWQRIIQLIISYTALVAATKLETAADYTRIASIQQELDSSLQAAKKLNDELRTELQRIAGSGGASSSSSNVFEAFKSVKILEDEYFRLYQASAGSVTALFVGFQSAVDSVNLYTQVNTARVEAANEAYWANMNEFFARQDQLEQARMNNRDEIKARKKEERNKIQVVLEQVKQAIGGCSFLESSQGDSALYHKLQAPEAAGEKGLFQKYAEMNGQNGEVGSGVAVELDKPDEASLGAMDLIGSFADAAESLRDELFMNEFALTKFNYRTFGIEKDAAGQLKKNHELFDPSTHSLAGQEVEYLLYGFSSCKANLASAYGEMFAFRMAVRTIEAYLDPKKSVMNLGSPLLVLLVAAAEGAAKAIIDMNQLVMGNAVELSAKLASPALKLSYKDYLRLFLLIHSSDRKLMARMQALIELNTGKDLREVTTYTQGLAKSTVRLWFIPGMTKLLNGVGLLDCQVQGNRCEIAKSTALSY